MTNFAKAIGQIGRIRREGFCRDTPRFGYFLGLAAPTGEVARRAELGVRGYKASPYAHIGEHGERFAYRAFDGVHGEKTLLGFDHRKAPRGVDPFNNRFLADSAWVFSSDAGLIVTIRLPRPLADRVDAMIVAGTIKGLSINRQRDYSTTRLSSGVLSVLRVESGGIKEVSLATSPAYSDTWIMRAGPAANERLIRERVEALERQHANAYIPGLSDLVDSRTPYQYTLKSSRRRTA